MMQLFEHVCSRECSSTPVEDGHWGRFFFNGFLYLFYGRVVWETSIFHSASDTAVGKRILLWYHSPSSDKLCEHRPLVYLWCHPEHGSQRFDVMRHIFTLSKNIFPEIGRKCLWNRLLSLIQQTFPLFASRCIMRRWSSVTMGSLISCWCRHLQ
jgi:hypothetical protein